uniref:Nuclear protein 1a n=2 Tax=Gasterosteus aculeatus aculeatus TaxID=481459 RepID=G3QA32_GASAC
MNADGSLLTASRRALRSSETRLVKAAAFRLQMATDMERFVCFEETYYDQYDYYNLREYSCHACGKGRSKREIELNTNRHCPAGHERKITEKYHNSEVKRRRPKILS